MAKICPGGGRKKENSVEEDISNLPSCVNREDVLAHSLSFCVHLSASLILLTKRVVA